MPGGLHFLRVFLVEIAHRRDLLAPVQGIAVKGHLGIQRHQQALVHHRQRIDLGEQRIVVPEAAVEGLHQFRRLRYLPAGKADLRGDLAALKIHQADRGIDRLPDDLLGVARGRLLDVHSSGRAGDDGDALRAAVDHQAEVVFLVNPDGLLDQDTLHQSPRRPGLGSDHVAADQLVGVVPDLVDGPGHLDAAALAAPAGMDLRLDHPALAAEFLGRGRGVVHGVRDPAFRYPHAVFPQQFLGLVFVDVQRDDPGSKLAGRQ